MTQDIQTLRQGMPTLHSGDLLSIVKARAGWFHPEVVAIAREELDRRGVTIPIAESESDAAISNDESAADDRIFPSWVKHLSVWIGSGALRDLLHIWLSIEWASGLATMALLVGLHWITPAQERKGNRASLLIVCLVGGVLSYLAAHFWAK